MRQPRPPAPLPYSRARRVRRVRAGSARRPHGRRGGRRDEGPEPGGDTRGQLASHARGRPREAVPDLLGSRRDTILHRDGPRRTRAVGRGRQSRRAKDSQPGGSQSHKRHVQADILPRDTIRSRGPLRRGPVLRRHLGTGRR